MIAASMKARANEKVFGMVRCRTVPAMITVIRDRVTAIERIGRMLRESEKND